MSNKRKHLPAYRGRGSNPVGERSSRNARPRQRPWLALVLVLAAAGVFGVVLIATVGSNGASSLASPTPTVLAGTPAPTLPSGPQPGIGILDPASGTTAAAPATPKVGTKAPDFIWNTQHGKTNLSALRGHAVVLEFFGPWCQACQSESAWLNTLAATYGARGLDVMAVTGSPYGMNYETTHSTAPVAIADMLSYQKALGVQYQLVLDPGTRVFNMYGRGPFFPTYYVIDRKGIVRYGNSSGVSQQGLTAQARAALAD
jgi:peroxiredoxin